MTIKIQHWARIGIIVQFLALIRILAEYLRLVSTGACADSTLHEYIVGALMAAMLCFAAVLLYFGARYRTSVGFAVLTIVALVVYKFGVMH